MTELRKPAKKAVLAQLTTLAAELAAVKDRQKVDTAAENGIKKMIHEIVAKYDLPMEDGKSQYLNIVGDIPFVDPITEQETVRRMNTSLRITRGEPALSIEPEKFRAMVGDDVFHRTCEITEVTVNLEAVDFLIQEEMMTARQLADCVKEQKERNPSIGFGPVKEQE